MSIAEKLLDYGLTGLTIFIVIFVIGKPSVIWLGNLLTEFFNKFSGQLTELKTSFEKGLKEMTIAVQGREERDREFISKLEKAIRNEAITIRKGIGKIPLSHEELIEIASDKILAASFKKLGYLKDVLLKNDIKKREKRIKKGIEATLKRYSSQYVEELNKYRFDNGTLMGDWVNKNFPMDNFLKDLYEIFFRDTGQEENTQRHDKLNDIQILMISYQHDMWEECKKINKI